jgi:polyisoprenyl-phosphate glycosyltransferase
MTNEIQGQELVSVILPSYNEELAIEQVIRDLDEVMSKSRWPYEILVVDDGSRDRTGELALQAGARVVTHRRNYGVGRARKTGIIHAHGEIIVMADADGTYPAEAVPRLVERLETCDMVIGARQREAGTMRLLRSTAKWFIRSLAGLISGQKIPDLNSGSRAFRKSDVLRFWNILPDGHSWVSTITMAYMTNDYEVEFIPIDYYERIGKSTFTPIGDTFGYLTLVLRTVTYFNPLRFFIPVSAFLGTAGVIKTVYDWRWLNDVKESDIMLLLMSAIIFVMGMQADLAVKHNKIDYMKPKDTAHTPTLPERTDGSA